MNNPLRIVGAVALPFFGRLRRHRLRSAADFDRAAGRPRTLVQAGGYAREALSHGDERGERGVEDSDHELPR